MRQPPQHVSCLLLLEEHVPKNVLFLSDDGLVELVLDELGGAAGALGVDHVLVGVSVALDLVRVVHQALVSHLELRGATLHEHGLELLHLSRADGVLDAGLHEDHSLVPGGGVAVLHRRDDLPVNLATHDGRAHGDAGA